MTGKPRTLVMSGGTRGIGRSALRELLSRDPQLHVILLTRTTASAESRRVTPVRADMERPASVRAAAATVREMLTDGDVPPLCGLALNAGISVLSATQATPDGLERTFAVNVLGPHLLIAGLAPLIEPPGRIVVTVSDAHFGDFRHTFGTMPPPRWADPAVLARPGAFPRPDSVSAGRAAYTTSKLAAIYLVHEWARRLPAGAGIVAHNPGLVPGTGLAREAGPLARFLMGTASRPMTLTPFADTVTAAGRRLAGVILGRPAAPSGSYIDRTSVARSSPESYDETRERDLVTQLDRIGGC